MKLKSKGLTAATRRKLLTRVPMVLGAFVIAYLGQLFFQSAFDTWEDRIVDRLFMLRNNIRPVTLSADLEIVHLDSNFYYSRSQHARVIRNLNAAGVSHQMIDFVFADSAGKSEDQPLINATRQARNVYFGMTFGALQEQTAIKDGWPAPGEDIRTGFGNWQVTTDGIMSSLYTGTLPSLTIPALSAASSGLGFLNLMPDPDGITRRFPLLVRYQNTLFPSLPLRVACGYLGVDPQNIIIKAGQSITLKEARTHSGAAPRDIIIPIDDRGRMILNQTDLWGKVPRYSYSDIFLVSKNTARADQLKIQLSGKIAILSEAVETPYQIRSADGLKRVSSGAVHTIVLIDILTGSFLRLGSQFENMLIELGLLAAVFLLALRFSSPGLTLGSMGLAGAYVSFAIFFFVSSGTIFSFIRPLVIIFTAAALLSIRIAIEKAVLFTQSERARRIAERELEIGREIQSSFFPTRLPKIDRWELVAHFQAARHVSGDFYDIFTLGEKKKLGIVIADVCDKGVGAALFMALFRSFIRVLSGEARNNGHLDIDNPNDEPHKILLRTIRSINSYISITHEQAGMFATIFYAILDPQTGVMTYINGGHEPPIISGPEGIKTTLETTGPAVGAYPDLEFKTGTVTLEPEDTLLVYTDGVIDAQSKGGEAFTKTALLNLMQSPPVSAVDLIDKIQTRLRQHTVSGYPYDDITMLAIRRTE